MKFKALLSALSDPPSETKLKRIPAVVELLDGWNCTAASMRSLGMDPASDFSVLDARLEDLRSACMQGAADFIFDISGGDMANTVLSGFDFRNVSDNDFLFFGYSDLTAFINALYAAAGKKSVLYQIMNLVSGAESKRIEEFYSMFFSPARSADFASLSGVMAAGGKMDGILVGGNIRCFLKLAGTAYMPDMNGKILLLEQYHGTPELLASQICHLAQLGAFEKISGLVLGTFTELQKRGIDPYGSVFRYFLPSDLPVFVTSQVGHGVNSKGVIIGAEYRIAGSSAAVCGGPDWMLGI
jgi:muramoyltetrapeptide carboxypeptidase LdcA involved in peptidoglycan recycling